MKIYRVYENVQNGCEDGECSQRFCSQETRSYHNNRKGALIAISKMIKVLVDEAIERKIMSEHNLYNLKTNRTSIRVGNSNSRFTSFARYEIEEIDVVETEDNGLPINFDQYGLFKGQL